jgi:hypothetical protein
MFHVEHSAWLESHLLDKPPPCPYIAAHDGHTDI